MNFIKKILLGGILVTTIIPATIVLSSCSTNGNESATEFDLGIPQQTEEFYGEKITEMSFTNPNAVQRKTMLITAGGVVNDKSFNQSAWGALELYREQAGIKKGDGTIDYRETLSDEALPAMYDQAMDGKYQTLVLTSFQQGTTFEAWLAKANNKQRFIESKAVIVGVDWDGSRIVPEGQFFGLGFKTEEPAWVVGYAAADYLTSSNIKPHLSSFGGGVFDGVTDFNNGFLQGMLDWNTNNPDKKVKFYSGNEQANSIDLSTGFANTPENVAKVNNIVGTNENAPQIILPVAGSLTTTTLDNIKDKNSKQLIIGVDANQSLAFPNDKDKFFSSIEKKVAVAVYKALILLAGIPLDNNYCGTIDSGFEGEFIANEKNAFVKYGFDKGLVDYSPSTIAGEGIIKANKSLRDAMAKYNSTPPTFESMLDASKNQKILNDIILEINK